ncbi:hypothetical protein DFH08DRAFT_807274 [Mycena albidolilacea]|uniref:Uncharacterized protein n=1 Tax=Mycena albidolilacea TaxID=1033008 RepID=A0AAD7A5Q0_9AGAR|nr:hypothetical protein DFH08DRAFT_807274 [Mycena albidolilacea]
MISTFLGEKSLLVNWYLPSQEICKLGSIIFLFNYIWMNWSRESETAQNSNFLICTFGTAICCKHGNGQKEQELGNVLWCVETSTGSRWVTSHWLFKDPDHNSKNVQNFFSKNLSGKYTGNGYLPKATKEYYQDPGLDLSNQEGAAWYWSC